VGSGLDDVDDNDDVDDDAITGDVEGEVLAVVEGVPIMSAMLKRDLVVVVVGVVVEEGVEVAAGDEEGAPFSDRGLRRGERGLRLRGEGEQAGGEGEASSLSCSSLLSSLL
jgi:hypothetical protein